MQNLKEDGVGRRFGFGSTSEMGFMNFLCIFLTLMIVSIRGKNTNLKQEKPNDRMQNEDSLLDYIEEADVAFEMQLLKDSSQSEQIWNQYIGHKREQVIENSKDEKVKQALVALLYRRHRFFEDDYEKWHQFIDYYIRFVRQHSPKNITEINKIIQCFELSMKFFEEKPTFWNKYLGFLIDSKKLLGVDFILDIFNVSLLKLKQNEHLQLWNLLFTELVNEAKLSPTLKFELYLSFFIFLKNSHRFGIFDQEEQDNGSTPSYDEIFNALLNSISDWQQVTKFQKVFNDFINPEILLKLCDSELELFRRYLERLIKLSTERAFTEKQKLENKIDSLFKEIVIKFPYQQSIFTIKYAKYLTSNQKFNIATEVLEARLTSSMTIKDFTLIFDSLTELLEKQVTDLSESISANTEELNKYMDKLEFLLSNRLILMNDVKLRQNINSPSTWIERIELLNQEGEQSLNKVLESYSKAVLSIQAKKVPKDEKLQFPQIWCDYAKVYIGKDDLPTARTLFETATKVPWTELDQLEYIWIEWIKSEIELNNVEHAEFVCSKAVKIPEQISSGKIDIDDESISVQLRLFRSIRLWSLYLDLVENCRDFDDVCKAYEDAMELKIINGVMIINYCLFLEENGYIEKSFSIFERGMNMFNGESKSILYCIYLNKILKYWEKLGWDVERVREIFEEGLDYFTGDKNNGGKNLKQVYILYSEWEMKFGSKIRSLRIMGEGISRMSRQGDKLDMYKILIVNTIESKGIESAVEVFQEAAEGLSVQIPGYISDIICGFVEVEVALGNVERGRKVLQYAAENVMEFSKSDEDRNSIWDLFKAFELENGDESTYKEMLRRKIYLENVFGPVKRDAVSTAVPAAGSQASTEESANARIRKEIQDRIGFVASTEGPKTTTYTAGTKMSAPDTSEDDAARNDDAIELDIDL